ncbi:MAG: immunoglobulin domain-containing protein [Bacteroidales bacterium]|nr:immunoglobulin domain-containing protein [Bacteroidales bacterium]
MKLTTLAYRSILLFILLVLAFNEHLYAEDIDGLPPDTTYCITSPPDTLTATQPPGWTFTMATPGLVYSANNICVFDPSVAGIGDHTLVWAQGHASKETTIIIHVVTSTTTLSLSVDEACVDAPPLNLSGGSPTGGTYSGTGVVGSPLFNPGSANIGANTITYTTSDGCQATDAFTVHALPNVTLDPFDVVCEGAASFALSGGNPSGGDYYVDGTATGVFDETDSPGSYTIRYEYTDGNGCTNDDSETLTVEALAAVSISSLDAEYCETEGDDPISGSPAGGVFSGNGIVDLGSGNYAFNASDAGVGTHTITYTYTSANGCVNSTTQDVEVGVQLTLGGLSADYCADDAIETAVATPTGGSYNVVSGLTDNGDGSADFDPSVAGAGSYTITYTNNSIVGCPTSISTTVDVHSLPTPSIAGLNNTYCEDAAVDVITGNYAPGGAFSGSGITDNGDGTADFDPTSVAVGGPYSITYSYTDGNGCSAEATGETNINPLPTAIISGDATICNGDATPIQVDLTGTAPYDFRYTNGASNTDVTGHGTDTYTTDVSPASTTTYSMVSVVDDNGCTSNGSGSATITVNPQVAITVQPVSKTVCIGANPSFSVTATGVGLSYQWQKDGANISGATNSTLSLSNVDSDDEAGYTCIVSSTCGGPLTSNAATLTLYDDVSISVHPQDKLLCTGEDLSLSVTASGSNLTYQWKKDNVDIAGENSDTYTKLSVTTADIGNYTCYVGGTCSPTESNSATVEVDAPIVITSQPTNKTACEGGNTGFSVTATGTSLTYQWQKGGVDLSGETSQSLTFNGLTTADAGNYRCVITSPCGETATSNTVTLTVNLTTTIDDHPDDLIVCVNEFAGFEVTASGSNLTYQWRLDGGNVSDGMFISGATTNSITINPAQTSDAGNYTVIVSGSCGILTSDPAELVVDDNIAITVQPSDKTVCLGSNTSLSVTATGSNLSYQWFKNGGAMSGETSSTLSLTSVTESDEASYYCRVSNSCGQQLPSNSADVVVNPLLSITDHPDDAIRCVGDDITLSVTATGTSLGYQWYEGATALTDGGNISGATSASLVISNLLTTDAGTYYCTVSSDCGTANSDPADLVVDSEITITAQPSNKTVCEGDNVNFSVTATGTNLSYQWQKDGTDLSGETNSTFSISGVAAGNLGSYRCVISNSCGNSTNSQAATLALYDETQITGQPVAVTVCENGNASFSVTATGSNLTYQWYVDATALVDGADISGSTSNSLSLANVALADAGNYSCQVTGSCGTESSNPATLVVQENTVITSQPSNKTVCAGANVTFSVTATGSNLTYQWQKDGSNLSGKTNATLQLTGVAQSDQGLYSCVVSGDCGNRTSNGASLTVNSITTITDEPDSDVVCEDDNISISITATGTSLTYQWQKDGSNLADAGDISGSSTNSLTVATAELGDAGVYGCIVTGVCGTDNSNAATIEVLENTEISSHPSNKTACAGDDISFSVAATGSNLTYQWQKDGVNISGETGATLQLNSVSVASSQGLYRCVVTGDCGTVNSNGAMLTVYANTSITSQPSSATICENADINLALSATGKTLTYQWQKDGSDLSDAGNISGSATNSLTLTTAQLADDGVYTCVVSGACGSQNSDPATLTVQENTQITTQPSNKIVCAGSDVTFSVVATGSNLTYQWQKDGANVSGETSATLQLTSAASGNAGTYRCVVTGDCGTVNSNGASLTVNANTAITVQPSSSTICEDDGYTFSLTATGTNLSYQWQKDGTDLSDAGNFSGTTSNSLTVTSADLVDEGVYICVVTGTCGNQSSTAASLEVLENTRIVTNPANKTVCAGANVSYTVVATGSNLTYQWKKDGNNINGATTSTLQLLSVQPQNQGLYSCEITGDCGTLNSNGASLTVRTNTDVTLQPVSDTVCENDQVTFSVNASGHSLSYQWRFNGTDLSDNGTIAGSSTYSMIIDPAATSNSGLYECYVTGSCGNELSTAATLLVNENLEIASGTPTNKTLCPGDNAVFNVTATGSELTYQWQKDGIDISGANGRSLILTNITDANEAEYQCVISSACGSDVSQVATLEVYDAVNITDQPEALTVCEGQSAGFTVIATGTGLTYEWRYNTVPMSNSTKIFGTDENTLEIIPTSVSDAGTYTCRITGTCGIQNSDPVNLIVNDTIIITADPVDITVCEGNNAIFSVEAEGTNLTYQWQKNEVDIPGANSAEFIINNAVESNEGTYRCVINSDCNTINSDGGVLTVSQGATITQEPAESSFICEDNNLNLAVTATGTGLTYQWRKGGTDVPNGGNISGATTSNLVIIGVDATNDGVYSCEVTSACGSKLSDLADVTIMPRTNIIQHPVDYTIVTGSDASFSVNAEGYNISYQWQRNGTNLTNNDSVSGVFSNQVRLFSVSEEDEGTFRVIVYGECDTVTSNPADLIVNPTSEFVSQPEGDTLCERETASFSVNTNKINPTYQWKFNGVDLTDNDTINGSNTANLTIDPVATYHAGAYTCVVSDINGSESSAPAILVVYEGVTYTTQPAGKELCEGVNTSFNVAATGTGLTYQWKRNNVALTNSGNVSGATSNKLIITGVLETNEGTYQCDILGACGGTAPSSSATLIVNQNTVITTQPTGNTLCEGENHTFSVVTEGTDVTYTWKRGSTTITNGGNVSGATTNDLELSGITLANAGSYYVVADGTCGTENSDVASLVVKEATAITVEPDDLDACQGDNVSFTISAEGDNITYQWRKDGVNLSDGGDVSGATTNRLEIQNVISVNGGNYSCRVFGTCDTVNSAPATLTVFDDPVINTQPVGDTICEGTQATFSVQVAGTGYTYQWRKDGVALSNISGKISGADGANLTISNVTTTDGGNYSCLVSGTCKSVNSDAVLLLVKSNAVITNDPTNYTGCEGESFSLVVAATGSDLDYQWTKDGSIISDGGNISGTNTNNLTVSNALKSNSGSYECLVTAGICNSDNSLPATVTVNRNTSITIQPVGDTICNGNNTSLSITATGDNLTRQWYKDGLALQDTSGYAGINQNTLSITQAGEDYEGLYSVEVTGACGSETSNSAPVVVQTQTQIITHPVAKSKCAGESVIFNVVADGEDLTYQWQQNTLNLSDGGNITGVNTNSLTINNLGFANSGSYQCVVSGYCGDETSSNADLTINSSTAITQQPVGDTLCEGEEKILSVTASGSFINYQWYKDGSVLQDTGYYSGTITKDLNISQVEETYEGDYSVEVTGICGDETSVAVPIVVNPNTQILSSPGNKSVCEEGSVILNVSAEGFGLTYQWQKNLSDLSNGGDISGANSSSLVVNNLELADAGQYRAVVSGFCGTKNSTAAEVTVLRNTSIAQQPVSDTVCEGELASLGITANGQGTLTYLWYKDNLPLQDTGEYVGATSATLNISQAEETYQGMYEVEITGACGTETSVSVPVIVNAETLITTQPQDNTSCEGSSIILSVTASGENLSYQWQKDNTNLSDGGNIGGATAKNLIINNASLSDEGTYKSIVTGDCGPLNSRDVTVLVNRNTVITQQPVADTVCEGADVTLSVSATGEALTYQWYLDGLAIQDTGRYTGAEDATLTISQVTNAYEGTYTCRVAGACGSEITSNTSVVVYKQTFLTSEPPSTSLCAGEFAVFRVTATGENLTYQWRKNGTDLSDGGNIFGATTNSLTVNNATTADNGNYTCVVTGECGPRTSNDAQLIVSDFPDDAGTISGMTSVCQGDSGILYSIPLIANADYYDWNVPGGVTITSGDSTQSILVEFELYQNGGNITVRGMSACGAGGVSAPLTVVASQIPEANAGSDQYVCADTTTLNATDPVIGNGKWTVQIGQPQFDDSTSHQTFVSNLRRGENRLVWTVTESGCSDSDIISIYNNAVDASVGADQTICSDSITLTGNQIIEGATGTWIPVSGNCNFSNASSPTSQAYNFDLGISELMWQISKGSCSDSAILTVDNQSPTRSDAGINQVLCTDSTMLGGNEPLIGTGQWSIIKGSATFENNDRTIYNASIDNLSKGDNILRWTIKNGICQSIDEVTITNNQLEVEAGDDQAICSSSASLNAVPPETGVGSWSVINGSGRFDNFHDPNTQVFFLSNEETNVLKWAVENNGCFSFDTVRIFNNSPTQPNAGEDTIVVVDTVVLYANTPTIGVGHWERLSGTGTIADPSLPNSVITNLGIGQNTFSWIIETDECVSADEIIVEYYVPSVSEAGPNQTLCQIYTTLDAEPPLFGYGEWSAIEGSPAVFADYNDPESYVTNLARDTNKLVWTVYEYGTSKDTVVIINNLPYPNYAGPDREICESSIYLSGSRPRTGESARWRAIGTSAAIVDDTLYNSEVIELISGANTFRYTVTKGACSVFDEVVITNSTPSMAYAGEDQSICTDSTILNPTLPQIGTGEWSGSAIFDGNNVSGLASGDNTLRWTVRNSFCTAYDEVVITNNKPTQARAGSDKVVCVDSFKFSANTPQIGTGEWSILSSLGSIDDNSSPNATVTGLGLETNLFRWTITNQECISMDEITIRFLYEEANAGDDQELCGASTILNADAPSISTGRWSVAGGSGAEFDDPDRPDSRVTSLNYGVNRLVWTVENEICRSDDEVIVVNNLPREPYAGEDQSICGTAANLNADVPDIGAGRWYLLGGAGNFADSSLASTEVTDLNPGSNTFRWTVTNGDCFLSDEVVIFNNSVSTSDAGDAQVICSDSTRLNANQPTYGTGEWIIIEGNGNFTDRNRYNSNVKGLSPGNNVFRWRITNSQCESYSDVTITSNMPTQAIAGSDQDVCGNETTLNGNTPTVGTGTWVKVAGGGVISSPNDPSTVVAGLNAGNNIFRWIIENQGCTTSDDVIINNKIPYAANAGADMNICSNATRLFGNDAGSGVGTWTVVSGNANFSDIHSNNPEITSVSFGMNSFEWSIDFDGCVTSDIVIVKNNKTSVNAGVDQIVNTSTTSLAASNPSSGTGTWTIVAGTADFENPNDPLSDIYNIGEGINTFRWTIDIEGCLSADNVTVNYQAPATASFVAEGLEGCPPLTITFINNSLSELAFEWDFGDGEKSQDVSVVHTYTDPGEYVVKLTVYGDYGEKVSADTTVIVYQKPIASFVTAAEEIFIPEDEAAFINQTQFGYTYLWDFGDEQTSTDVDPFHTYTKEGVYDVTLFAWSDMGCTDTLFVEEAIKVTRSGQIEMPNAFTPSLNGSNSGIYNPDDISNDVFHPYGEGVDENSYSLEIYTKWGTLIFRSTDINIGWDGYYKGKLVEEGAYVWKVSGKYNNGEPFEELGTVLVLH